MSLLSDALPIGKAAKAVGMRRTRVREIALKHRIAILWGGGEKRQVLKVKLSELEKAILLEKPEFGKLNRRVKC